MYYEARYALGKTKLKIKEHILKLKYLELGSKTQNYDELCALKSKFTGQRCFIVGNGPSLNSLDLSLLKNEHCFLFNGAYELIDKYDLSNAYLAIEDRLVMEDHRGPVNKLSCKTFIPSDLKAFVDSDQIIETFFSRSFDEKSQLWPPFVNTENKTKPIFYWGGTVAYFGLQLAAWMGFSECYIIGVDLTYSIPSHVSQKGAVLLSNGDDPNHYDSKYFGAGKRWHVPQPERMLRAFNQISSNSVTEKMPIYNAGVGGNLNCFPRVKYEECFNGDA